MTIHTSEKWPAQQIIEAFPADRSEPKYLIRDRDSIYGGYFRHRLKNLRIRKVSISPRSPWQNGIMARWIRTMKEECLCLHDFESLEQTREIIGEFIQRYNKQWILERHGCRTPADVRRNPLQEVA